MQLLIDNDDSKSEQVLTQVNAGGAFKLHAADDQFDDERGRVNQPMTRTVAGTGAEAEATYSDSGTAYGDPIEITWGMRAADPDNPALADFSNEEAARAVEFFVKAGNLISAGVFDPGEEGLDEGDAPWPNEENDGGPYSDAFFDWQNAKPVFFAGGENGAQGEGSMGIFIPGDFGADGSVGVEDFQRLVTNWGGEGTTYSRGDLTQDGFTNIDDASAWAAVLDDAATSAVASAIAGGEIDFGGADAADIEALTALFGDGSCVPGNGDLDGSGVVDFSDFLTLSANFGQEADAAGGDIDCSGTVAFADFLVLSANFGQTVGAASVPEPSGVLLLLFGFLATSLVRKRRS